MTHDEASNAAIEELIGCVQKAWEKDEKSSSKAITTTDDGVAFLFEKMLADRALLNRILVARKNKMEDCVDLFFEQLRFRIRWKPESIQPEDIPNALPCKCAER